MKKETLLCSIGRDPAKYFRNVNTPIFRTSTFIYDDLDEFLKDELPLHTDTTYARSTNVTNKELADAISVLYNVHHTEVTSSGLSSVVCALMSVLRAGDHLLIPDTAYKCTKRFVEDELEKCGISFSYYNAMDVESISIKDNTKVMFIEAPGSGTFEVPNLSELMAIAKSYNIITIFDNTWATPLYCNPFEFGADIVVMSLSKHISGHADLILGSVSTNDDLLARSLHRTYINFAPNAGPDDAFLALRGLRSLSQRLKYQQENANEVISFLSEHKCVFDILSPTYIHSSSYNNWKRYFTGASGVLSFALKKNDMESTKKFINSLKIIKVGLSWGGYESLIVPYKLDALENSEDRLKAKLYMRLSCGLEHASDLINDLESALSNL